MNWIADGSFELDLPIWDWVGVGAERKAGNAQDGGYYARSYMQITGPSEDEQYALFGQRITLDDTEQRRLRFWVRRGDPPGGALSRWKARVRMYEDPLGFFEYDLPSYVGFNQVYDLEFGLVDIEGYKWVERGGGLLTFTDVNLVLVVDVYYDYPDGAPPPYPLANVAFAYDKWSLLSDMEYEAMTKRQQIRDAVVSALQTITTGNGHNVELENVRSEIQREDKIDTWPEAQVLYGDEVRRMNEMHRKKSNLFLHVLVWTRGDTTYTAENQQDEIVASVETVLETQANGQYLGLGYVENVTLEEIIPFEVDSQSTADIRVYRLDVRVEYRYGRLSP